MDTAIVLMKVDRANSDAIAEKLTRLPGVGEVYAVAGVYDLIALIHATSEEGFRNLVERHMRKVEGVWEADLLPAERTYSRRDVDGLYSGGLGP